MNKATTQPWQQQQQTTVLEIDGIAPLRMDLLVVQNGAC